MRNEATLQALSAELQRNCGDELAACQTVGVSLMFLNQWRKDDKLIDEQIHEALRVGVQGIYSALVQRAIHGVQEDVWYRGDIVGSKTSYSDMLLNTLAKAKLDDFKDETTRPQAINVNIANLMPRAETYDQWLSMKENTLTRALNAPDPDQIIEAEYVEVPRVSALEGIDL